MFFERSELCRGVHLNIISTDKFKRNYICINFVLPHNAEYASQSSLLGDVLMRGTEKFPNLRAIERELDECYSAQISAYSNVKGESKVVTFSMESIADCYAFDSESIFARSLALLSEVMFKPVLDNGIFVSDYVESEKEKLLAAVRRQKNSKRRYALDMCKKKMCSNEPYGISSYGTEESISAVTPQSLYEFYTYMLQYASVELFFVGSELKDKVKNVFCDMFGDKERAEYTTQPYPCPVDVSDAKYICEDADYKQSVLVMGYRTNLQSVREHRYAFSVFNAIFGSGVNSKLFKIVRESMHLCYCSPENSKGVAFVSSGIDASNEEITKNAIIEQLENTKNGIFTDDDITDCKMAIRNAFNELYDSAEGMCGWYLGRVIFGDCESMDSVLSKIESVTRDQIMSAAALMKLDTVFMLRGVSKISTPDEED